MNSAFRSHQQGFAAGLLLFVLIATTAYLYYRHANRPVGSADRQARLAATLARAKEALIARAVADDNRPGTLPCPDLVTDNAPLANIPGDGKADLFTMTRCPSYVGWLPWVTLDLPEPLDSEGNRLWYVLSPELRDDDSAQPINSDILPTLHLDGHDGIAALIIAPGQGLAGQNRPSKLPADHLDGENGNGDDHRYVSGPTGTTFNDVVLAITRAELMAAVEQRVANTLHRCLDEHARNAANPAASWPWPAPLSNMAFKGRPGSLFGRVPTTQPGNPEAALAEGNQRLAGLAAALQSATTPEAQTAALRELSTQTTFLLALYDRLQSVAASLQTSARAAQSAFQELDDQLAAATQNSSTLADRSGSLPGTIAMALTHLPAFREALTDSGFDTFLMALEDTGADLTNRLSACKVTSDATSLGKLATPVNEFKNRLLAYAATPNPAIASRIATALELATTAAAKLSTARKTLLADDIKQALDAADALSAAEQEIATQIGNNRLVLSADEVAWHAQDIELRRQTFSSKPDAANRAALQASLTAARRALGTAIGSEAAEALERAIALVAQASPAEVDTAAIGAAGALTQLAGQISTSGDNVLIETLTRNSAQLSTAAGAPPATLTAARALRTPTKSIVYWADLAATQAADIARLARRGMTAQQDSDTSAYSAARLLLQSIDTSLDRLRSYGNSPTAPNRSVAEAAYADTTQQLATLAAHSRQLDDLLDASWAEGVTPTRWHGAACAPFAPGDSSSWWQANRWQDLMFYQIDSRYRMAQGRLSVNGAGTYRIVVLSAGSALRGQERTPPHLDAYLEGANAEPSRDGDAPAPVPNFVRQRLSPGFNDRLAY